MSVKIAEWLPSFILFIIGGIFLILSVTMIIYSINFRNNAVEHIATIGDISSTRNSDRDTHYTVHVRYKVDGLEYNESLGYYNSDMFVGKEITIYYKPQYPERIMGKSTIYLWFLFLIIGLILHTIAFIITFIIFKKKRRNKELLASGRKIYADITKITKNYFYAVNRIHPFLIICKWTDPSTGQLYFFKSENIWFNPAAILEEKAIKSLSVYIDSENPKKYVVSLEEVKQFFVSAAF